MIAKSKLESEGVDTIPHRNASSDHVDHLKRFYALFIIVILLAMAIQIAVSNKGLADEERTFTIGLGESITSANPFLGVVDADYLFYFLVYNCLIFPNEDGMTMPNIAESWWMMDGLTAASIGTDFGTLSHNESAEDWPFGSIWEFNITDEVYWNDGVQLTAEDVRWTIDIQIGANFMTYWAFQPYTRWIDRIDKVNDYKVRIFFADYTSKTPIPIAWGESICLPILPKHAFEGRLPIYLAQEWNGLPLISSGPFKGTSSLENEIISKESITLVINPFYNFTENGVQKGLGAIYNRDIQIDRLILKFFTEEQTQVISLKTGSIDACRLTASNYLAMKEDVNLPESIKLVSMYSATVYSKLSHWNVKEETLGSLNPARLDPAIQRASFLATNKTYINDAIFKKLGTPGYGLITPVWSQWHWEPTDDEISWFNVTDENGMIVCSYNDTMKHILDFDLDRANDILDAAGYNWTGTPYQSVREIGPTAAKRLIAMGYADDYATIIGMDLDFEQLILQEVFEDKQIGEHISQEWAKIGLIMTENLVNIASWSETLYTYTYHFTESYWSGDVDPNYLLYIMTSDAIDGWNEFGTENKTYDYYYAMQAQSMDYNVRKHWVDECLKWQYLHSGNIVTSYPKTCFAYNDGLRWTNWGDWEAHPGLAVDHFWGDAPILYQVKWVGDSGGIATPDITTLVIIAVIGGSAIIGTLLIMMMRKRKRRKAYFEEDERDSVNHSP
ncbi:MAG: ABC transporter substrate-binding protein [Thermoplasmata archaeon]|nr:ABC transporter substrate-binding protein [Thermoplasmata archaeon]